MFISAVYIRFYRSFNYDYLRKAHEGFSPDPWDLLEPRELQYPFVQVSLEDGITTVVGANESGKSQLLAAVKHALTGLEIERSDFCRYSQFFAVDKSMAFPDFGLEFKHLDDDDRAAVAKAGRISTLHDSIDSFLLFRFNGKDPVLYLPEAEGWQQVAVKDKKTLDTVLPRSFEIDAKVALPESVPITYLAEAKTSIQTGPRKERYAFLTMVMENAASLFGNADTVPTATPHLVSAFTAANTQTVKHERQLALADDLLLKVAKIDRIAFKELLKAVEDGRDGFANGIVEQMNRALAASLNFPKWWSQDHEFKLLLTLRDQDLVFTIRDRTGTEYSADERSGGLKYFLSYFVQYLAHEPPRSGNPEILLMDEPDAYLSSTGQQDLLRIFEDFADPQDPDRQPCQVVYVTHSPFLIDKNHGERIRVLEKGEGDEGTRVVRNAARNHYEPLRSAFGSFVAETTFISNCNLMLEGTSDQVLLAGMSARLRRQKTADMDNLDLNTLTLVPAGSAQHIPYMLYLARGRDVDRPAVIVLLDSDTAGNQAVKSLKKGPNGKPVIDPEFILQLGDISADTVTSSNPASVIAIDDLIPVPIGIAAVKRYAAEFLDPQQAQKLQALKPKDVNFDDCKGAHDALERAAARLVEGLHLDKVGLARSVLDVVRYEEAPAQATETMDANFRVLFRELRRLQRRALREATTEKASAKIKRLKRSFLLDHPTWASREAGLLLLDDIETGLDNSIDAEDLRSQIRSVRRDFTLDDEPTEPIPDFPGFRGALDKLVYREINEVQEA
ncbi:AAA family ATPase [Micromonospora sp. RL09-050-HVF-A]|uniref:AAA family ATPase n=1 Tax=Micromonospora sp. RL09-050-HVF-A TaxID=1703433 RepID=UPI001C5F5A46|nr:AAA family ATPase [Micromonospora sp. RL09-050-HVF-A]MBW4705171.1 AAA family ATPase [Micromonospora sp. RL09-050-HVF-A]